MLRSFYSPIAAAVSPDIGGQADPEQPLPDNVRSGSATVSDADDFPGDRPVAAKGNRKFLRNIVDGE